MSKYLKIAAFAVSAVAFDNVSFSARADGPLPAPASNAGQKGANRRVITPRTGFTAVRGRFSASTDMKATNSLPLNSAVANSKPTFYIGASRRNSSQNVEVDAGVQYEWEIIPFKEGGIIKYAPSGWGIFCYANKTLPGPITTRFESNPRGGWRGGPGTLNNVTSFDLTWVFVRRVKFGVAQNDFYGYLEVLAIGASDQPRPKDTQADENPTSICRLVPHVGGDGVTNYNAMLTDSTSGMAVKRVVGMTQGGSYNKFVVRNNAIVSDRAIPASLNFPLPTGGLYDEDGSYMRGCSFSGIGGTGVGQVAFGVTPRGQSPAWQNWGANVEQDSSAAGTGFYPNGFDKTLSRFGSTIHAIGSLPYFEFPSLPDGETNSSQSPGRYNSEIININLRSGISVSGSRAVPGGG